MKEKLEIIDKSKFLKWAEYSNNLAKSQISFATALKQYNSLSASKRIAIKKDWKYYEEIKKSTVAEKMNLVNYALTVLVELNIIATEYDIDPLVVAMCINSPCKNNSKIFVK